MDYDWGHWKCDRLDVQKEGVWLKVGYIKATVSKPLILHNWANNLEAGWRKILHNPPQVRWGTGC